MYREWRKTKILKLKGSARLIDNFSGRRYIYNQYVTSNYKRR